MKLRRGILSLLVVMLSMMALAPLTASTASAAPTASPPTGPISRVLALTGTVENGGTFVGTFNLQNISNDGSALLANGTLTGTLRDAAGTIIGTVTDVAATLPVNLPGASCQILHLVLGPLDLNLLGLMVHLNQVVLDITAQSGPGNLLGNLLCAVAHLLDLGGPFSQIAALLNQILTFL